MLVSRYTVLCSCLLASIILSSLGCLGVAGPSLGIASIPIPVSPYFQDKKEDEFWEHERYGRVAVLPPLAAGGPTAGLLDPPSDDQIMRALEHADPVEGGLPLLHEHNRNNVKITRDIIAEYVDPPRVYPLIGPAQLHHVHYKCTIYYTDVVRVGWPVPHTLVDEDAREVIYIDKNHFHRVGGDSGASLQ